MAAKPHHHSRSTKLKPEHVEELLAQADPDNPGPPPQTSSMPVGSIAHTGQMPRWLPVASLAAVLVAIAIGGGWWLAHNALLVRGSGAAQASTTPAPSSEAPATLLSKSYGNKYANGLLPVGDGKYTTSGAKQGYIYACGTYAQNLSAGGGGASTRGPWFTNNNTQWDVNKKSAVAGHVTWPASFSDKIVNGQRVITSNDLPSHYTGVFPVAANDPAYKYDRNPNKILAQTLAYSLAANPALGAPQCMGGQAGVMTTGVALFNAFDAGGRDAGAWEVQDGCDGHPEKTGEYHYHTLSRCVTDTSVSTVIGFALDGFPITGPKVGTGSILTTADLDVCHGITSQINLDGKPVTMYHYVMTQDFPYSVSCFRAKAIQPPGLPQGGGQASPAAGAQGTPPPAPSKPPKVTPPPKPLNVPPRM